MPSATKPNDIIGLGHEEENVILLSLRMTCLTIMVVLLTLHIRSVRVFRWEQSVSGGLLVTYTIAAAGLALCAGMVGCEAKNLQAYLTGSGGMLLGINAVTLWRRWRRAGEMTRAVAELLGALGLPIRRQVLIKTALSASAAILLMIDFTWSLLRSNMTQPIVIVTN